MEDPISREAHRIEIEQTEIQVQQMIHTGVSKFLRGALTLITQVQRDEMIDGYRITVNIVDGKTRHRAERILAEEAIGQYCVSVKEWQDFIWTIIRALVEDLKKAAPHLLKPERTGDWYETGQRSAGMIIDKDGKIQIVDPLGRRFNESARKAEIEARQQRIQEQMTIESIKKAMKRS